MHVFYESVEIPDFLMPKKLFKDVLGHDPMLLEFIPDSFKTKRMCKKLLKIWIIQCNMLLISFMPNRCVKVFFYRKF